MKRKISGRKFLQDVRSGLSDHEIMAKYRISLVTLQRIYQKLSQEGLISDFELRARIKLREADFSGAFSSQVEGELRCPECGEPLPRNGGHCSLCATIDFDADDAPPPEMVGGADVSPISSNARKAGTEFDEDPERQ